MAFAKRFEDLECWKEGAQLTCEVFRLADEGELSRHFVLRDQMCGAALSIPSNIAEGFERDSKKYFANALRIAKGSSGELRTQLYVAAKLDYIDRKVAMKLVGKASRLAGMLSRFARRLSPED